MLEYFYQFYLVQARKITRTNRLAFPSADASSSSNYPLAMAKVLVLEHPQSELGSLRQEKGLPILLVTAGVKDQVAS